jgi:hypothetical protein
MKYFIFLLAITLTIGCTTTSKITEKQEINDLSWLNGTWTGVGYQSPTNSNWKVRMSYDKNTNKFSINYPSLNCSGKWKLQSNETNKITFTEYITKGKQNCDNEVKVVLSRIDDEYVNIAYFLPGQYDGVVAYGVLRKVEMNL